MPGTTTGGKIAVVPETHGADDRLAERAGKRGNNTFGNDLFLRWIPGLTVRHSPAYDRLHRSWRRSHRQARQVAGTPTTSTPTRQDNER